jgi:5-formyltetrahydrofolate cyclo-ligase
MNGSLNSSAEKASLRMAMMKRLREMTAEDRQSFSEEICERVLEMSQWAEAQNVILFSPLPSEPIILPLKLDCEARKVSCATMPQSARSESDRHRLGRGGGFFDRLLAGRAANAFKLGICFPFQILDNIPMKGHDIAMDAVVYDKGVS